MIVTDISNGISKALYELTGAPIYVGFSHQNTIFPCYVVEMISSSQKDELRTLKQREYTYDILYFYDETGDIEDEESLCEIAEAMYSALEFIDVGNYKAFGRNMNYRITDGVLHFFVTYTVFVDRVPQKLTRMQRLIQETEVKQNEQRNGNEEDDEAREIRRSDVG